MVVGSDVNIVGGGDGRIVGWVLGIVIVGEGVGGIAASAHKLLFDVDDDDVSVIVVVCCDRIDFVGVGVGGIAAIAHRLLFGDCVVVGDIAVGVVVAVVVVAAVTRFDLSLLRRIRRSAAIFFSCSSGVLFVCAGLCIISSLTGDGVGGIAGAAQSVFCMVEVELVVEGVVGVVAGVVHVVVSLVGGGVFSIESDVVVGECGCLVSASTASSKNFCNPARELSLIELFRSRPPKRLSVLWFGMKSASEL